MPLREGAIRRLLQPFGIYLSDFQIEQISAYIELLLRWNASINLTGIQRPADCVTRHFGESLYLAQFLKLAGKSLDIGSGAGFPGLALKIHFSELQSTLLEPVAKKRAFLKEVVRRCGLKSVEVRPERLSEYVKTAEPKAFDSVTSRAVGGLEKLVPDAGKCLKQGGKLCLWISSNRETLPKLGNLQWSTRIPIPESDRRSIVIGTHRRLAPVTDTVTISGCKSTPSGNDNVPRETKDFLDRKGST